jgi:hypothetical protein
MMAQQFVLFFVKHQMKRAVFATILVFALLANSDGGIASFV